MSMSVMLVPYVIYLTMLASGTASAIKILPHEKVPSGTVLEPEKLDIPLRLEGQLGVTQHLTNMRNEQLMMKALCDYGCTYDVKGDTVIAEYQGKKAHLKKNAEGTYELTFKDFVPPHIAKNMVEELSHLYAGLVQQAVYEKLMSRASERGLKLESEETQNDNSIVLTFLVEDRKR